MKSLKIFSQIIICSIFLHVTNAAASTWTSPTNSGETKFHEEDGDLTVSATADVFSNGKLTLTSNPDVA